MKGKRQAKVLVVLEFEFHTDDDFSLNIPGDMKLNYFFDSLDGVEGVEHEFIRDGYTDGEKHMTEEEFDDHLKKVGADGAERFEPFDYWLRISVPASRNGVWEIRKAVYDLVCNRFRAGAHTWCCDLWLEMWKPVLERLDHFLNLTHAATETALQLTEKGEWNTPLNLGSFLEARETEVEGTMGGNYDGTFARLSVITKEVEA